MFWSVPRRCTGLEHMEMDSQQTNPGTAGRMAINPVSVYVILYLSTKF